MIRNSEAWIEEYKKKEALWIHDGNPKRPHALLSTAGVHSSGFFNSELVMEDATLLDDASYDLVRLLTDQGLNLSQVDRVVGPAMGAITMAHSVAAAVNSGKLISEHHLYQSTPRCLRAYTEKEEGDKGTFVMVFKRTVIRKGERILQVEDVVTTGVGVELTSHAVINSGGSVLPFVAVLVNRSGLKDVYGKKIVSLIDHHMPTWHPHACPLCQAGSEAIRPKYNENWARLNAVYS